MTLSNILIYLVVIILIAFTLLNLYSTMTAKKRKAVANAKYQQALKPVEQKLLKLQKERNLNFDKVKRLINDEENAIIFASDSKALITAIGMAEDTLLFKNSELADVKKLYENQGKKVLSAKIEIKVNSLCYTYNIGTRPFNPKGFIGKVIYEDTEELYTLLNQIKIKG